MVFSRPAAEELARLGFRVVDFDYGSGASDPEPRTMLDQVADVIEVMDAAEVSSATLVGLSRGAMTAYALAADFPERVTSLVLVFPVCGFSDTLFLPVEEPDTLDRMLYYVFSEEFISTHREEAVALFAIPPGEVTRVERGEEEPFREDMEVSVPTLVLEGGGDQVVSSVHPARYLEAIPGAEHAVIRDATHRWFYEEAPRFAGRISEFVKAQAGSVR